MKQRSRFLFALLALTSPLAANASPDVLILSGGKTFTGGKWMVKATVVEEGKQPVAMQSVHEYPVAVAAVKGCADVMNAMPIAIEAFLYKLYSDSGFHELFR